MTHASGTAAESTVSHTLASNGLPPNPGAGCDTALRRVEAFAHDASATSLSLAGLGVAALSPALFGHLGEAASRIERLDLACNKLTSLPDWLCQLPRLRVLFLLGNPFSTIPPVLRSCDSIFMLSFKSCALAGPLDDSALPPNLGWLILTDNAITCLSPSFGERLSGVRKLMLANNRLNGLPGNMMDSGMGSCLELLRLNNNLLEKVPECVFAAKKLAWLGLGGNPCSLSSVRSLAELDQSARVTLEDYEWEKQERLGSGASGEVHLAQRKADGHGCAIKFYRQKVTSDGSVLDELRAALAVRDVEGLIPVLGFFGSNDGSDAGLVMDVVRNMSELAGPPSFSTVSRDVYPASSSSRTLEQVLSLARRIAGTAAEMHSRRWAHGDLYGHNILVSRRPPFNCYLTDLGASYKYEDPRVERIETRAFGILLQELLSCVDGSGSSPSHDGLYAKLFAVSERCTQSCLTRRPAFSEIACLLK